MQYILSKEEYDELLNAGKLRTVASKKILQDLCTKVCDNMPISYDWCDTIQPHGCILTTNAEYCDDCPVSDVCPYQYKEWSK